MCMCAVNPVEVQVNLVIVLLKKMSLHLSNVLRAQRGSFYMSRPRGPWFHNPSMLGSTLRGKGQPWIHPAQTSLSPTQAAASPEEDQSEARQRL